MRESNSEENLIATLEQSLRQTRNAQNRLAERFREAQSEAERLRQEIAAMEKSAESTESAIYSLLTTIRSGSDAHDVIKNLRLDTDYEVRSVARRDPQIGSYPAKNIPVGDPRYRDQPSDYRDDPVAYINTRGVPSISRDIEPLSARFSDRTITQACTLLLRETGNALHVNELYNLLVSGGFKFTGNNPTISIAVSLNRNSRFVKVAPGTFDLVMRDASRAAS